MLWAAVAGLVLPAGFLVAPKRAPEIEEIGKGDNEMEMILHLAESAAPDVHLVFRRSRDTSGQPPEDNAACVTFYSPRTGIPAKLAANHFRLAIGVMIFNMMRLPRFLLKSRFIMSYTDPTGPTGSASKINATEVK